MKYFVPWVYTFFLLTLLFFSWFGHATNKQWQSLVSDYEKHLVAKLKSKGIPGGALSIVNGPDNLFAKGVGVTKFVKGRKIDTHTRFRLASVSKTFAGSLTAKLANEGRFSLEDPVSKFIPKFSNTSYKNNLKVYHLLSHSGGLVPNAYDNLIESRMSYPDIVAKLLSVEPICKPGQCYGYQNVMFSLVDEVIKTSTKMDYSRWLNEFVFAPLQMNDASLGYEKMITDSNYAHPHVRGRKRWHTARLKQNYYKVLPAAGVNASASDMAIWLKAQLGYYPSVLSPEVLADQTRPYTHTKKELRRRVWKKHLKEAYYGLGWRVYNYDNETLYYHSGWVQGYRSDIVIMPHLNIGFSLILNAETGLINELTTEFIDRVLAYKRQQK
ncbi:MULTISPECIES: serine hydrolase domain-containing protein [unclassified Pseudoalteromonas]|uniref:serine hydrolase domain-containing protein n=1 Tax=unclassified Pseudoalteromonas TaxID=194690 RepID=UPI0025B48C43|nr:MULTISPECIES: serine hydrolase domain-containing protein [unclassified Pseudoalteromonas]MDN3378120.1 serine hydrolase domain-containing protein [Pseudoalteromonas sp. APC 3893]MDN3386885.1 serine hydrolase domain-containing protein [Pseudoalteromonas sp. APC 4017]